MPQPDSGDDIKREELELQVVPYTFGRGPGRPLFLTARRFIMICKMIEKGISTTQACRQALVSYAGFRSHVVRNSKYQRRLQAAELCRDHVYRAEALDSIRSAFAKNWPAAMTFLERKWPGEFSLRRVDRSELDDDQQLIGDRIPAQRLAQYGALMLEVAEENKARPLDKASDATELPDAESA